MSLLCVLFFFFFFVHAFFFSSQAKTGTGKTGAYAVPVIQGILASKKSGSKSYVAAIVLVPTKELSKQVKENVEDLCKYCNEHVKVVELSALAESVKEQKALLRDRPDIVVATPARIAARIADKSLDPSQVKTLVIDEADLVLGYGYTDDVESVLSALPASRQTFLMSATLGDDVQKLQSLALNRPALVKIEEEEDEKEDALLHQLSLRADSESDKFLIVYVMLKLQLIQGKSLVFVNSIRQGFKLKLLLQAFFVPSVILNSELPENSRAHILEQFNGNEFSLLIATDEAHLLGKTASETEAGGAAPPVVEGETKKRRKQDSEYGVARGVDFKHVRNVINFDFPTSAEAYIHRIGRTARAGARGNAISFVCNEEEHAVLDSASAKLLKDGTIIKPFAFKMGAVEAFRYRVEDVLSTLSKTRLKDAQSLELKQEIVRSQALKSHWEEHPKDLQVLLHDVNQTHRLKNPELKHIPDYLMPTAHDSAQIKKALGRAASSSTMKKKNVALKKKRKGKSSFRADDPLQTLSTAKRDKK